MSSSVISHGQFSEGRGERIPTGHWHPGMGSKGPDKGYKGPGGAVEGAKPDWQRTFAGELRKRGDDQSGDPVIRDKANRKNVQLHPNSERNGPAGVVSCCRTYSNAKHTDTGRNVKILPSAHGNGDFRRASKGGE